MPTDQHVPSPRGDGPHHCDSPPDLAALLRDDDGGDWREQALCAQTDPDAFFPDKGGSTKPAKAICNGGPGRDPCPVRAQCLEWALANDVRFGVLGGLSERERRKVAMDRRRAAGRLGTWQVTDERREAVRRLTAEGRTAGEIAAALAVTVRTVERLRGAA